LFFGEFMVQQGIIRKEELQKALDAQKYNTIPLGQLAVQEGFIRSKDLFRILSAQRKETRSGMSFGKLAVEMGYLTQDQIEDLLVLQTQTNELLGESLISLGFLDKGRLIQSLRAYRAFRRKL